MAGERQVGGVMGDGDTAQWLPLLIDIKAGVAKLEGSVDGVMREQAVQRSNMHALANTLTPLVGRVEIAAASMARLEPKVDALASSAGELRGDVTASRVAVAEMKPKVDALNDLKNRGYGVLAAASAVGAGLVMLGQWALAHVFGPGVGH